MSGHKNNSAYIGEGGVGGGSIYGTGGKGLSNSNQAGVAARAYGAGGGGANNDGSGNPTGYAGGAGKAGIIIVEEYA